MLELKGTLANLRMALSSEDYDTAASLLQQYCQDLDAVLKEGSADGQELVEEALRTFPVLMQQVRASRSHHIRDLSLIQASKHYQVPALELYRNDLVG
ncbi:MAG: hypothetical protein WKF37_17545 [Bryobacteraceae bacterium]